MPNKLTHTSFCFGAMALVLSLAQFIYFNLARHAPSLEEYYAQHPNTHIFLGISIVFFIPLFCLISILTGGIALKLNSHYPTEAKISILFAILAIVIVGLSLLPVLFEFMGMIK